MKKILFLFLTVLTFISCKDPDNVEPGASQAELISLSTWELQRFTDATGQSIPNSELNTQALFLYAMYFEFQGGGEVRGVDKTTKSIIDKGVWSFLNDSTSVNVKLTGLDYDFRIIELKTNKLTLQAPTGNFLSEVGDQINLEFNAVN
ncbi:MAG: hypothetical protein NXI00_03070 [Cytophagales bacterium]|nr:hypothetical protein [Cytophagales bacterium]